MVLRRAWRGSSRAGHKGRRGRAGRRSGDAAAVLALCSTGAFAQSTDFPVATDTDDEIIVVTANRTGRAISQVGESVTVIGETEIVNRQPSEVLDLLRTVPGVTFNRNGGIGSTTGVSVRGASNDQLLVLIDGVRVADTAAPATGFDFGTLSASNVSKVELLRGSNSVVWGADALGGVAGEDWVGTEVNEVAQRARAPRWDPTPRQFLQSQLHIARSRPQILLLLTVVQK